MGRRNMRCGAARRSAVRRIPVRREVQSRCRDVRGADPVTVSDSREALHRSVEQPAERLGLGLAQLGKLRCHVRYRTMVLAQLLAAGRAGSAARGRRIAVSRECVG